MVRHTDERKTEEAETRFRHTLLDVPKPHDATIFSSNRRTPKIYVKLFHVRPSSSSLIAEKFREIGSRHRRRRKIDSHLYHKISSDRRSYITIMTHERSVSRWRQYQPKFFRQIDETTTLKSIQPMMLESTHRTWITITNLTIIFGGNFL